MIPALFRFHGHNSLRYVYANGKAVRSQALTLKWVKNTHRHNPRFSVVVSKKVIKGAVGRNRIRRRLYEYLRLNLPRLNGTYDIVLICTSAELRAMPASELSTLLEELFLKADLYKTS
ncbi:MAG: ribonuclease P protein component [Candidatus Microsaccharimonas sp.]